MLSNIPEHMFNLLNMISKTAQDLVEFTQFFKPWT